MSETKYTAAVITVSDKGFRGEREDTSGPALCRMLAEQDWNVVYTALVPDEKDLIKKELLLVKRQLTNASNYSKYHDGDVIIANIKKVLDKHNVDYSKLNKLFKQHAYRDIAFEAYEQILDRECMYYYWSKCEWEVIVSAWPPRDGSDKKIDVYSQLKANWEQFKNIIIEDLGYAIERY